MSKRRMCLYGMSLGLVLLFSLTAFPQRSTPELSRTQQVVVEHPPGVFHRGWIQKNHGGKEVFTDATGKSADLDADARVYSLAQMNREYQSFEQSLLSQRMKTVERYSRMLDWSKERQLYEQVVDNARKVIQMNPANPDPSASEDLKRAQEALESLKDGPQVVEKWTMVEVQKIRFALLPVEGTAENLQITFRGDVLKRFIEEMNRQGKLQVREDLRDFNRMNPTQQAQIIKRETGTKYQPDIVIARDPAIITDFRRVVQPLLNQSCARPECHGGETGNPALYPRASSPPEIYYNFYALDTYRAEFGDLLDRVIPERSLLLTYLLPKNLRPDQPPHSTAFVPLFRTPEHPRYQALLNWIKSLPSEPIDRVMQSTASDPSD